MLGAGDVRRGKIYLDPTHLYYNGINIAKDRANKLLENFPLPGDPSYPQYLQQFADNRIPNGVAADNMQYFNVN
jgi:hypothetical protein